MAAPGSTQVYVDELPLELVGAAAVQNVAVGDVWNATGPVGAKIELPLTMAV
jgi:hypothetical protein